MIIIFFPPSLGLVQHNGNLTMDQVIDIARTMRERSMSRHLSGTVKEILGTCQSVGCKVEHSFPHDKIDEINDGTLVIPVSLLISCYSGHSVYISYSISFHCRIRD